MSGRKSVMSAVFLAGAVGFSFGWGERQARAIVPCPQQPCIQPHAWYTGAQGFTCLAAFDVNAPNNGGATAANRTQSALPPGNYAKQPDPGVFTANVGQYAQYIYPDNVPECGMVNGQYQLLQKVSPRGVPALNKANAIQHGCIGPVPDPGGS